MYTLGTTSGPKIVVRQRVADMCEYNGTYALAAYFKFAKYMYVVQIVDTLKIRH